MQVLEIQVRDSHLTGRANLGRIEYPLRTIPPDGHISSWLPIQVCPKINQYPNACSFKAALAQKFLPVGFDSEFQQSMLVMASMQSVEQKSTSRRKVYF